MFKDLIEVIRWAGSKAALAERTYRDRDLRAELRTAPEAALTLFGLGGHPTSTPQREIPATWRFRMEPRKTQRAA